MISPAPTGIHETVAVEKPPPGAPPGAHTRRRAAWRRSVRLRTGATSVGVFSLLWQLNEWLGPLDPTLVASPRLVLGALPEVLGDGLLSQHGPATVYALVAGFMPAVAVGILIGAVVGYSRRLTYLFEPLIMAFYVTPRIAFIPILIMWLGIGVSSRVAIVFLSAVFPVLMNSLTGVQTVDRLWLRSGAAFGATRMQAIRLVVIPGALSSIMAGVRLGFGRALIGVIVAEMYVSTAGIGKLIRLYQNSVRVDALFVVITAVTIFGLLGISLLRRVERRVSPWQEGMRW
ncbi:MAG: ABC-type nitrate/sulfonate/bicarbonate transport system, permease component [Frankiales bacterium]|jgi:ABC-type nitrate/sulfonate/bicarbonate transport system permease component|nr:ABC-type nitrate/sulfonate/bicarbonate transport system, permease component [Frankiales bacterium]